MPVGLCGVLTRIARVLWRDRAPHLVPVDAIVGIAQAREHGRAAAESNDRHIRVVAGLEQQDLVARLDECGERGVQPRRRTGRDLDLGLRIEGGAVAGCDFAGDRLAQRQHAGHGRVLVVAGTHGARHGVDQRRIAVEVRESPARG